MAKGRKKIADNYKTTLKEQVSGKLNFSSSIPELHKMLVRDRIKNTKPNELINWDKVHKEFKLD